MQITSLSKEEAIKVIESIRKTVDKARTDIQRVAVTAVEHSVVHGDVSIANALYGALNNGTRRDALVAYFEQYGNLAWMRTEKSFKFFQAMTRVDGVAVPLAWTDEYAAKVAGVHWTAAKREAEPVSQYDVEEAFRKFMDRVKKAEKDGANVKHAELLTALGLTFNQYVSETALKQETPQS